MEKFNFILESVSSSAVTYDNAGAYQTLQEMMKRNEKLSVRFSMTKESVPCAWIESSHVAGFRYLLKEESFAGIMQYLNDGTVTDFDSDPMSYEPLSEGSEDFQVQTLKAFVESGKTIQYTPAFRESPNYITGSYNRFKGTIFFRLRRDEMLVEYLRDNMQAV